MYLMPRNSRPLIMGRNGVVCANHPLAALAGLDILRAGGNAFDAATTTALTLAVVEPMMSGLGGDGIYHAFVAGSGEARIFNGTGAAPRAATPERFGHLGLPSWGPHSVSTPGALAGLAAMHSSLGRLSWGRLLSPAIVYAREGFAVTHTYCRFAAETEVLHPEDDCGSMALLLAKTPGTLLTQPELAQTLEEITSDGAETFYRGRLATRLATSMHQAGVLVDAADLAACTAEVQEPIAVGYRDFTVTQTPPNSVGYTLLLMLKMIECFDIPALDPIQRIHVMVEAKKRAFIDYERYGSDPRYREIPLEKLLSVDYAAECAATIDPRQAQALKLADPESVGNNTTYFCIVDIDGNAVSGIQSLNSAFGSGVIAGDTGVLLNNRMAYWHLAPGHVNVLFPGKRVRHTMNAPMIFRDGKLWAVEGTPGGDNQVQVNLQVLSSMMDLGVDPQTAIESPRWSSSQQGQGVNWPHDATDRLTIEAGFDEQVLTDLERLGHKLNRVGRWAGPCVVEAIRVMESGLRMAGSDPRGDGWAAAY